jgi:hypothetical protein
MRGRTVTLTALFGITSERRRTRDLQVNLSYRGSWGRIWSRR